MYQPRPDYQGITKGIKYFMNILLIYALISHLLFMFQTPGRVGSQGSDLDSSATPVNTVDVNNESSSEV